MNERTRDTKQTGDATPNARGCDREEQLVAHLYGEATPAEQASFTQHLRACAVCREELAAFRGVHELVAAERNHALGAAPALDVRELFARQVDEGAAPSALASSTRGRSAVAALREFFALAPLWLRAGAFAGAAVFCALVVLTVTRGTGVVERERVVEKRVEVPVPTGFTQEQVDALVAERLKDERAAMSREMREAREAADAAATKATAVKKNAAPRLLAAGDAQRSRQRTRHTQGNARRGEQLAEDDLPRLSDLLGGAY